MNTIEYPMYCPAQCSEYQPECPEHEDDGPFEDDWGYWNDED
jgi:hypothetical protein